MLRLSKKVEYALMALKYLADNEKRHVHVREICQSLHTPFDTTSKVLQNMHKADWVGSIQGAHGGYFLNTHLDKVSLYDIHLLLEGDRYEDFCSNSQGLCSQYSVCNIISPIHHLNKALVIFFKQCTLQKLLNDEIHPPISGGKDVR